MQLNKNLLALIKLLYTNECLMDLGEIFILLSFPKVLPIRHPHPSLGA